MILIFFWFIIILFSIYIVYGFLFDIEILNLVMGFLLYHIYVGFQTLLNDYFHIKYIKYILLLFLRVSILEISRYIFEFFL